MRKKPIIAKVKIILFLILCIGYISKLKAQFTPYIQNFNSSSVALNGQNWDISQSTDGSIYVANTNGLLSYNGLDWHLNQLPSKSTIRSVLALSNKIYTGSYQEFGYWEKDPFGTLKYHSITEKAANIKFQNEEIWQIVSFKNVIIFRSFYAIYVYDGKNIISIVAPSSIISMSKVYDELWIATLNHGIYKLIDNQLIPFIQDSSILGKKVIGAVEYKEGSVVLGTELNGLWKWQHNQLATYEVDINSEIKKYQLNKLTKDAQGDLILGTIQNGVYYSNGHQKWIHLNRKNGLENNTVLALWAHQNNQLWLGLDNGIARVNLSSSNAYFNDLSGNLGAVYDLANDQNQVYVGSNTGLYRLMPQGQLTFIPNTQGQVWNLSLLENDLLCGHNNGTYLVKNQSAQLISPFAGGYLIKKAPHSSNIYLQATYAGLVKFQKINGQWKVEHLGEPYLPIRYFEFEEPQTAWAVHSNKGLFRIQFSPEYDSIVNIKQVKSKEWSDYNLRIYKIKNDIALKTNNGWFVHDPLANVWKRSSFLNSNVGKEASIISKENPYYYVIKSADYLDFRSKKDISKSIYIAPILDPNRIVLNQEVVGQYNDSLWFYNLKDGFRLMNGRYFHSSSKTVFPPVLDQISYDDTLLKLNKSGEYQIPFSHSMVKLSVSSPENINYHIQYAIQNSDSIFWQNMKSDVLEFNHLYSGENILLLRTLNDLNQTSSIVKIIIDVSPPWYLSKWAYLLYFIMLIMAIYYFYLLHKNKLENDQKLLIEKLEEKQSEQLKQQQIENEKKLIDLRNQNLKKEIKHKSKELANHSMALIRKNESLQEIRSILNDNRKHISNSLFFNKLLAKIDISLKERKDEWEFFESNFSQIHDDFFETLQRQHPKLNKRDLKLCAYIKMNLITKEIAPLMNLSIRGIETHKYRLKKKLGLSNDDSLSDYLKNIS